MYDVFLRITKAIVSKININLCNSKTFYKFKYEYLYNDYYMELLYNYIFNNLTNRLHYD